MRTPAMKAEFKLAQLVCWIDPVWDTIVEGDRNVYVESNWKLDFAYSKKKRKWMLSRVEYKTLPANVQEGQSLQEGTQWVCPQQPLPEMKNSQMWDEVSTHFEEMSKLLDEGLWVSNEEYEKRRQFLRQRKELMYKIRDPPKLNFWNHKNRYQPWQRDILLQTFANDPKVPKSQNPANEPVFPKAPWEIPVYSRYEF